MNDIQQFIDFIKELGGIQLTETICLYSKIVLEITITKERVKGFGPFCLLCYKNINEPPTKELHYFSITELKHKFLEDFYIYFDRT